MSAQDAVEAMKLPAPIWTLNKQDPGFLMAMAEAMAEKGVKGSEAAVSLRAFTMAASGPKSTAMPMLANAGIDMTKFQERNKLLTPEGFVNFEKNQGKLLDMGAAKRAFAAATDEDGLDAIKLSQLLNGVITHSGKARSPVTPNQAQKDIASYFNLPVMKTNMMEEILKMREMNNGMGPTASQMKQFGEGRQAPRWTAFLNPTQNGGFDPFEFAMKRMYGDNWKEAFDKAFKEGKGAPDPKFLGNMQRQAVEHMQGLEGAYTSMKNAVEELNMALYDSGFYKNVADGLHWLAGAITSLAHSDPATLKHVAEGLAALAAVGPVAWLGGTLLGVASGMSKLGVALMGLEAAMGTATAATEAEALATSASVATTRLGGLTAAVLGFGVTAGIAAGLILTINEMLKPENIKRGLVHHGNPDPGTEQNPSDLLPGVDPDDAQKPKTRQDREPLDRMLHRWANTVRGWNPNLSGSPKYDLGDAQDLPTFARQPGTGGGGSLTAELAALRNTPVNVQGDVKGQVDVHSTMTVSPSQWFVTKIDMLERVSADVSGKLSKLGETMAGSNAAKKVQ
jgi:hypothetical protein